MVHWSQKLVFMMVDEMNKVNKSRITIWVLVGILPTTKITN